MTRVSQSKAVELIKRREPFTASALSGGYPPTTVYPDGGMVYVVYSYRMPIAVHDGETWHVLDSKHVLDSSFISTTTSHHLGIVRRAILGSEYSVVPSKASMDALIERLVK